MAELLVVEDDVDIATTLRVLLARGGHRVTHVGDGRAGLRAAYQLRPELVILDVGLPGFDGWQVLERLRDLSDVPVLLLTAHDREEDKVRGLRTGADDYLTKPFGVAELLARVDALLRRAGGRADWSPPGDEDGVVHLDPVGGRVTVDGRPVDLTPTEFRLLGVFVRNAGQVLSPRRLLAEAWDDPAGIGPDRVKFAVLRLRRKLGWADPDASPLESVRGFGYRYRPPDGRTGPG